MQLATDDQIARAKMIPGFHGFHVTDTGDVISFRRGQPIVKRPQLRNSYLSVLLTNADGKQVHESIHVLVLLAHVGPRPTPKHQVRHLNGNAHDNRLSNLSWGTARQNAADRHRHGRYATTHLGEQHASAKLNERSVLTVIERLAAGERHRAIARDFNVSPTTIGKIANGRRWKHVTACFRSHVASIQQLAEAA